MKPAHIVVYCSRHPGYTASLRPTADCPACQSLYAGEVVPFFYHGVAVGRRIKGVIK